MSSNGASTKTKTVSGRILVECPSIEDDHAYALTEAFVQYAQENGWDTRGLVILYRRSDG